MDTTKQMIVLITVGFGLYILYKKINWEKLTDTLGEEGEFIMPVVANPTNAIDIYNQTNGIIYA